MKQKAMNVMMKNKYDTFSNRYVAK